MEPIFKYCSCGQKFARTDTHAECMYCLTLDHDSANCSSCQKLKPKALRERKLKLHAFINREKVRRRAERELRRKMQPGTGAATTSTSSTAFDEAMLYDQPKSKEVPKTSDTSSAKEATTSKSVTSLKATVKKKHVTEVTTTPSATTVEAPAIAVKIVSAKHKLPVKTVENVEKLSIARPKSVPREVPKMAIPPQQQIHPSSSPARSKKTDEDLRPVDTEIKSGDKQRGSSGQTQTYVMISAQPPSETQGSLPIAGASLESVTSQDVLVPAGPAELSSKSLPLTSSRRRMSRSLTPTEEAETERHRHTSPISSRHSSHHSSIRDHRSEARSEMSGHFSSDQHSLLSHAESRRHVHRSRSPMSTRRHSSRHLSPLLSERSRSSRRRSPRSRSSRHREDRSHSSRHREGRSVFSSTTSLLAEEHRRREARRREDRRHESRRRSTSTHRSRSPIEIISNRELLRRRDDDIRQIQERYAREEAERQRTQHRTDVGRPETIKIHGKMTDEEKHVIFCSMFQTDEDMENFLDTLQNDSITQFRKTAKASSVQVQREEREITPIPQQETEVEETEQTMEESPENEDSPETEEEKVRSQSPPDDILTYGSIMMEIAKKHNIPQQVPDFPKGVLGGMLSPQTDTFSACVPVNELIDKPLQEMFHMPTKVPATLQRQEKKYRPAQTDKVFLKQHPVPDKVITEAIRIAKNQIVTSTYVPADPESKRMDNIGKKVYSSASTGIRCANAQAYMSRYQFDNYEEQKTVIEAMTPENMTEKVADLKKTVEKGKTTAVQQLRIAKDSADLAGRAMTTAIVARRQAWARMTDFRPEVQTAMVNLPFEGESLFGEQLEPVLASMKAHTETARSLKVFKKFTKKTPYQQKKPDTKQPAFQTSSDSDKSRNTFPKRGRGNGRGRGRGRGGKGATASNK